MPPFLFKSFFKIINIYTDLFIFTKTYYMRFIYLSFIAILFFSCQSNEKTNSNQTDSLLTNASNSLNSDIKILEDLFLIKNEKELKQLFGDQNVSFDTIWGAEGMFYMGTKLFNKTPNEVIITWGDTLSNSNITNLSIRCYYDINTNEYDLKSIWKSKTGISLGTTLTELVKLNGKEITFYGLGWDYGGLISSWNGGKLENAGIGISLGTVSFDNQTNDYNNIVGDTEINSSNPSAVKVNPVVLELFVSKTK